MVAALRPMPRARWQCAGLLLSVRIEGTAPSVRRRDSEIDARTSARALGSWPSAARARARYRPAARRGLAQGCLLAAGYMICLACVVLAIVRHARGGRSEPGASCT